MAAAMTANAAELTKKESAIVDIGAWTARGEQDKMKPICFDPCAHTYRIMGDVVVKAFSVGNELM